jgi:hypothetical protein
MQLVIIESPLAGDVQANQEYARDCCLDALKRGEAPFASHLLYTQMLDDTVPIERKLGIEAGLAWGNKAEKSVVYVDRGISRGMVLGIRRAIAERRPVEYRRLGGARVSAGEAYELMKQAGFGSDERIA